MPRLHIAIGLYEKLMVLDHDVFFQDPYRQAQRALMLADTLLAAHAITDPREPSGSTGANEREHIEIDVSVRAAKADFALRHFPSSGAVH